MEAKTARKHYDTLRLEHEAATAELADRRERLKQAEARRPTDPAGYQAALVAAREQRDRVVVPADLPALHSASTPIDQTLIGWTRACERHSCERHSLTRRIS